MTSQSIADDVTITRQLWRDHVNSDISLVRYRFHNITSIFMVIFTVGRVRIHFFIIDTSPRDQWVHSRTTQEGGETDHISLQFSKQGGNWYTTLFYCPRYMELSKRMWKMVSQFSSCCFPASGLEHTKTTLLHTQYHLGPIRLTAININPIMDIWNNIWVAMNEVFGQKWGDSPITFMNDAVMSENYWWITSRVTKNLLFMENSCIIFFTCFSFSKDKLMKTPIDWSSHPC